MSDFGPTMPEFSELAPGIRRLVAPNPSMMTGPGTNTYLFGNAAVAVLDPGPVIETHIEKLQAVAGAPIRWVLVTHTHPDHSPGAVALARRDRCRTRWVVLRRMARIRTRPSSRIAS